MSRAWSRQGISRDHLRTIFRDWFGILETSAEVLVELYEAAGAPVMVQTMRQKLSSHRPLSPGALHERISVLRSAMEPESVDYDKSAYFLTEVGFKECEEAVRDVVEVLSSAFRVVPSLDRPKRPKPAPRRSRPQCETIFMFDERANISEAVASAKSHRILARA